MLGIRRRIARCGSQARRFSIAVIDCKSLAAHVTSHVNSAWRSVAYIYILSPYRKGRNRFFFLSFFFGLPFLFPLVSNSTAGSSFRSFSSRRQHAELDCRESSVEWYPFFCRRFFLSLSEMTIVSMDACDVARQVASTVAERRRRYARRISLQAAFVHPNCEVLE